MKAFTFTFTMSATVTIPQVLLVGSIYDEMLSKLKERGGYVLSDDEKAKLQATLWVDGVLNATAGEDCEDGALGGATCQSEGFFTGDLACTSCQFQYAACSNCGDSSECDMGNLCAPVVDLDGFNLGGYRDCVAPGSIPNDSICDDTAEGDLACAGLCAPVDTGFGADIPICGDCETDADCAMGETCVAGMAGQGGLAGNSCQ